MLPKSVSPRFVWTAGSLIAIPLIVLEVVLCRKLHLRDLFGTVLTALGFLLSLFFVRMALSSLGVEVRSQSVERFRAIDRESEDEIAADLPIRICLDERATRFLLAFGIVGLMGVTLSCFPRPAGAEGQAPAWMGWAALIIGLMMTRLPRRAIEITEEGICAPDGILGRQTFVPWEDLTRCEIIHDSPFGVCDHFVLWDRAGRARFRDSVSWMDRLRQSDRNTILRALRLQFPDKEKREQAPEPALARAAPSALWDRELDG